MANKQYHSWYQSAAWQKRRKHQLQIAPLCKACLDKGKLIPACVADHVVPHAGNYNLFTLGALQSLCFHCHNSRKKMMEQRGYHSDFDEQGWPLDPSHPTNVRARANEGGN
jgi:5-methylcytosine-specific restriction endonuclease McrA